MDALHCSALPVLGGVHDDSKSNNHAALSPDLSAVHYHCFVRGEEMPEMPEVATVD